MIGTRGSRGDNRHRGKYRIAGATACGQPKQGAQEWAAIHPVPNAVKYPRRDSACEAIWSPLSSQVQSHDIPVRSMQEIIIIAGPNGAGKTSFANEYLPAAREGLVYINADEIAHELG